MPKSDHFMDSKCNDRPFWADKVIWCRPPNYQTLISSMMNKFSTRCIKGYICLEYNRFDGSLMDQILRISKHHIGIKGRDTSLDLFIAPPASKHDTYLHDVIVCYFDFRRK